MKRKLFPFLAGWLVLSGLPAVAQFPITYQGRLIHNGQPANGSRTIFVSVHDQPVGGNTLALAPATTINVVNGLFTYQPNLPAGAFTTNAMTYLEVVVDGFILRPRVPVTFTPKAFWADEARFSRSTLGVNIGQNGAIGLGTQTPEAGLHVRSGIPNNTLLVDGTNSLGTWFRLRNSTGREYGLVSTGESDNVGPGYLLFRDNTNNSTRMVIDTFGNVGINTTATYGRLTVNGHYYGEGYLTLYPHIVNGASGTSFINAGDFTTDRDVSLTLRTSRNGDLQQSVNIDPNSNVAVGTVAGVYPLASRNLLIRGESDFGANGGVALRFQPEGGMEMALAAENSDGLNLYGGAIRIAEFSRAGSSVRIRVPLLSGLTGVALGSSPTGGSVSVHDSLGGSQVELYTQGALGYLQTDLIVGAAKFFKIDHPLDPENRSLYHASIESDEYRNLYDGAITTDEKGFATVILPQWFEALNRDFRYQLTVVDGSEDFVLAKLHQPIKGGRFVIRTSKPNVLVNWQVTGIRQDRFALDNPMRVEVDKADEEAARAAAER